MKTTLTISRDDALETYWLIRTVWRYTAKHPAAPDVSDLHPIAEAFKFASLGHRCSIVPAASYSRCDMSDAKHFVFLPATHAIRYVAELIWGIVEEHGAMSNDEDPLVQTHARTAMALGHLLDHSAVALTLEASD